MRFRLILDVSYALDGAAEPPSADAFHRTLGRALAKFARHRALLKGLDGVRVEQVAVGLAPVPEGVPKPSDVAAAARGE